MAACPQLFAGFSASQWDALPSHPPVCLLFTRSIRRWGPYREGVVKRSAVGQGSWLDVGLDRDAHIPQVRGLGVWKGNGNDRCPGAHSLWG